MRRPQSRTSHDGRHQDVDVTPDNFQQAFFALEKFEGRDNAPSARHTPGSKTVFGGGHGDDPGRKFADLLFQNIQAGVTGKPVKRNIALRESAPREAWTRLLIRWIRVWSGRAWSYSEPRIHKVIVKQRCCQDKRVENVPHSAVAGYYGAGVLDGAVPLDGRLDQVSDVSQDAQDYARERPLPCSRRALPRKRR